MTIRQIFYQHLGEIAQLVPKAHKQDYSDWANEFYEGLVGELAWLVRKGKVEGYDDLNIFDGSGASEITWQEAYVPTPMKEEQYAEYPIEVWVEKNTCWNALMPLFTWNDIGKPAEFRLNLISGKGFVKMQQIEALLKKRRDEVKVILYLTDFDPAGINMYESLDYNLNNFQPVRYPHDIKVERFALYPNQIPDSIKQFNVLPNDVTKKSALKFKAQYGDDCYELEALSPEQLRDLVRKAINDTVSKYHLSRKTSI
jgi:hypothetical protein